MFPFIAPQYDRHVAGRSIRACGHVFTPSEVESLAARAGLRVRERHVIDYKTGKRRRFAFQGQLLYVLEHGAVADVDREDDTSAPAIDSRSR